MNSVKFKIDGAIKDNLTWDDIEILEGGKIGKSKDILARFVVDESENPVPFEQAKKQLGKLTMTQVEKVMQEFLRLMTDSAVNPPTAAS